MPSRIKKIQCPICEAELESGIPRCPTCDWELNSILHFESDESYIKRKKRKKALWEVERTSKPTHSSTPVFEAPKQIEVGFGSYAAPLPEVVTVVNNGGVGTSPPVGIDIGNSNSKIAGRIPTLEGVQQHVFELPGAGRSDNPNLLESIVRPGKKSKKSIPVSIKHHVNNLDKTIKAGGKNYALHDVVSNICSTLLKNTQPGGLGVPAGIVLAVPAYFKYPVYNVLDGIVDQAIKIAYQITYNNHLDLRRTPRFLGFIPSSLAMTMNYAYEYRNINLNERILAVDFGAGGIEISVLSLFKSSGQLVLDMKSVVSTTDLSGKEIDRMLLHFLQSETDNTREPSHAELMAAEQVKMKLTSEEQYDLSSVAQVLNTKLKSIDRETFESVLGGVNTVRRDIGQELRTLIDSVLRKAELGRSEIEVVLSSGGCVQIPYIQRILQDYFPGHRTPFSQDVKQNIYNQLFYSVAKGAALHAALLLDKMVSGHGKFLQTTKKFVINTCTTHALGFIDGNSAFIEVISANTPVPWESYAEQVKSFTLDLSSSRTNGDPDHVCEIVQGTAENFVRLLELPFYIHVRKPAKVSIFVKFRVFMNNLNIKVSIPGRGPNKRDINIEDTLKLHLV